MVPSVNFSILVSYEKTLDNYRVNVHVYNQNKDLIIIINGLYDETNWQGYVYRTGMLTPYRHSFDEALEIAWKSYAS